MDRAHPFAAHAVDPTLNLHSTCGLSLDLLVQKARLKGRPLDPWRLSRLLENSSGHSGIFCLPAQGANSNTHASNAREQDGTIPPLIKSSPVMDLPSVASNGRPGAGFSSRII